MRRTLPSLILLVLAACTGSERAAENIPDTARLDSLARARQDSINRARPDYVVDSIFPPAEALRRFRAEVGGDSATKFTDGSASLEALVRRFVEAVAKSDTNDLRRMAVTVREFTDLYYMESPYSHPPYQQPVKLAWSMIQAPSSEGITRVLREFVGKRVTYVRHSCDAVNAREGTSVRHSNCEVVIRDASGVESGPHRFFGSVIERDGQFKFLGFANRR